jgi:cytidylate kinase
MEIKVIAISGMPGAGSSTIGRLLAQELSMKSFSPGQLFKDIALGRVREQHYYKLFKHLCDLKGIKLPEVSSKNDSDAVIDFWNTEIGKSKEFHEVLDLLQIKLSKKEKIVIDGKLSLRMLPDADLKIWLKANIEARASRAAERDKISIEEAKKKIIEREKKERDEWKKIYGFDYFEQEKDADIIIDASYYEPRAIVDIILANPILRNE